MDISIGSDKINLGLLFPFAFFVDRNLVLSSAQPSLLKLCPNINGKHFTSVFSFRRPWTTKVDFEFITKNHNQLFLINILNCNLLLKGQFVILEKEEQVLFIGSPWVTDTDELVKNNLSLTDFALSDSVPDMLQLLKVQDNSLKDIEHLIGELKHSKELAEESTKAKEIFLANMSHEMRTPLNGIIGISNILQKTTLSSYQKEHLDLIKYSADNLLIIINDILDLAKIEAGKLELECIDFDLVALTKKAVNSLFYKAEEKGIKVTLNLDATPIFLQGDSFRFSQILVNLISNAIKFTEKGEVVINFEFEDLNDTTVVKFGVKDTGIGIHEDNLKAIFESFKQADSNTTRKYGGTGLGLPICKKLIELQGGTIQVKSELGLGSIFKVEIPFFKAKYLSDNILTLDAEVDVLENKKIKNAYVLVAEDNEINQFLIRELLLSWGINVDIANNGREALDLWSKNRYDLILMDIQMPELGGVEATVQIRTSLSGNTSVPIIALTANALKGQKDYFMSFGMDDYISKPFEEEDLYRKIRFQLKDTDKLFDSLEEGVSVSKPIRKYDMSKLDLISHGNKDFKKKLMNIFIDTVPVELQRMQDALAQKDYPALSSIAHKLKTTIIGMKINDLEDSVKKLESDAFKKENLQDIPDLVVELTQSLSQLVLDFKDEVE